jgi:GR25 family glycosyltransferase involved in LPS biosynthesis
MENPNNEHFGGVFYINLNKRSDRREEIEKELNSMEMTYERFEGIEMKPGIVGCGYSHLAVLKEARDRGLPNVLIFEDDFEFLVSKEEFWTNINSFFEKRIPYDVLMFSYNIEQSQPFNDLVFKVNAATTASAYVVNSYFYDSIIGLYEENLPILKSTGKHWIYANDQIWKRLQPASAWYAFNVRLGRQRGSYSDNSLEYMDRGV